MNTTQIVIVTILSIIEIIAAGSLFVRMVDLDDGLWVEPLIMIVTALFIYLVAS